MSYIGNLPTNVAFVTDTFSGNGSTVAFTMSVAPATTSSILVAVTGVLQDPSTYSVSGTTLTFSAAPPSGTANISVRYLGIPASGVTTTAYRTVTEFTATAGQTTFSVPSYTVGYIDVYRNGSRLNSADYTASNGTTVVLAAAANAGDSVTTESFYVSSVLNAIPATAGAVNSTYLASDLTLNGSTTMTGALEVNGALTNGGVSVVRMYQNTQVATGQSTVAWTGIPSWAKRITLTYTNVDYAASTPTVYIGDSSGYATTGYTNGLNSVAGSGTYPSGSTTQGWYLNNGNCTGNIVITNIGVSNVYSAISLAGNPTNGNMSITNGFIQLSDVMDRIKVSMSSGTMSSGYITLTYEG